MWYNIIKEEGFNLFHTAVYHFASKAKNEVNYSVGVNHQKNSSTLFYHKKINEHLIIVPRTNIMSSWFYNIRVSFIFGTSCLIQIKLSGPTPTTNNF